MNDRFYVYRPLLDLIGYTEGTDTKADGKPGRGYNETLSYGAYTGGPVSLVTMTLKQVDGLQSKMLAHPSNKWNSSAAGRYQIVRTTRRAIEKQMPDRYPATRLFDADCQDEMACYLLGQRGIDKWLAGRMSTDTLLDNLSKEWASIPKAAGGGAYAGQNARVNPAAVIKVLGEVKSRHAKGQPVKEVVPAEVEKVAEKAERQGWWQWPSAGLLAGIGGLFRDYPEVAWIATGGVVVVAVVALVGGRRLVQHVKEIAEEVRR